MFISQKIQNVLTSGHTLRYEDAVSNSLSSTNEFFLTKEWNDIWRVIGSDEVFLMLTTYSLFLLHNKSWIQLAGPPLNEFLTRSGRSPHLSSFSISSLCYRLSFSKSYGFPSTHIFAKLNRLNGTLMGKTFVKTIHKQTALILLHEMLRPCYPHWDSFSLNEEIDAVATGKKIRIRFYPRLEKLLVLVAKVLFNSTQIPYGVYLHSVAPLPSSYLRYNSCQCGHLTQNIQLYDSIPSLPKDSKIGSTSKDNLSAFVSSHQVFDFVRKCLRRLLPHSLFSSRRNWRSFYNHIYLLISSTKKSGLRLDELVRGIKLHDIDWLKTSGKPTSDTSRFNTLLLYSVMSFLIKSIVVLQLLFRLID